MARPEGTPFWGESVGTSSYAYNVTGAALPFVAGNPDFGTSDHADASALVYRGALNNSAPSVALSNGDAIQITADATGITYLADGEPVEAFWAVEVIGGAGTLHLSQVIDSTNFNGPIATTTDLGSVTITGPGTYTVAAPGVSSGYIYDRIQGQATGLPIATIACTGGAVDVQQVKMRLWPAGGPLGDLTGRGTEDGYSSDATRFTYGEGVTDQLLGDDDTTLWNDAWAAARTDYAANRLHNGDDMGAIGAGGGAFDKTLWTTPVRALFRAESVVTLSSPAYRTTVELIKTSAWINRPSQGAFDFVMPAGVDGIDYIRQPGEVPGDPVAYAKFDTAPAVSWEPLFIENEGEAKPGTQLDSTVLIHVAEGVWPIAGGRATFNNVGMDGAGTVTLNCWPGVNQLIPLPVPNVPTVRVTARHEWFDGGQPGPHGSGDGSVFNPRVAAGQTGGRIVSIVDGAPAPPRWHVEFSPYSFWVPGPTGPNPPVRFLRQVQRNDGRGLSGTPRWRGGSSRQSSNRWVGYT